MPLQTNRFVKQFSQPKFGASDSRESILGLSASVIYLSCDVSIPYSTKFISPLF